MTIKRALTILSVVAAVVGTLCCQNEGKPSRVFLIRPGYTNERISSVWRSALESRMNSRDLDSVMALSRPLTADEEKWKELIESRAHEWSRMRDSLSVPFGKETLDDTLFVMVGYMGRDDGFTYRYEAVCFDVTALQREYGSASLPENHSRIDRLFAHEFMHLLHKDWARRTNLKLTSFRDSILWECLYEGIGMYRSLSQKWLPVDGVLPQISETALEELSPVFVDRLSTIESKSTFTEEVKIKLHNGLSRGPVKKKWGALPVGLWLALEAKGKDENLAPWIDAGLSSVIQLAKKYLRGKNARRFAAVFSDR